jgi:excinuclease ABC subunit A
MGNTERARVIEALEAALRVGHGLVNVHAVLDDPSTMTAPTGSNLESTEAAARADIRRFSTDLHCPDCDIRYRDPAPSLFSFNSPLGACDLRGGRVIGGDRGAMRPDATKTLRAGAIKRGRRDFLSGRAREMREKARPADVRGATSRGAPRRGP